MMKKRDGALEELEPFDFYFTIPSPFEIIPIDSFLVLYLKDFFSLEMND